MHVIRLREPWQVELQQGCCLFRRRFNCPTGLERGDVVRLVVDDLPPDAVVRLNGAALDQKESPWDIFQHLQPSNLIEIEPPEGASIDPRPFGEVRLEIEPDVA
jgi:hypothetical protein